MIRKALLVALILCAQAAFAAAEGIQEQFTFDAGALTLANLIGKIRVEPATGTSFEVTVVIGGRDAAPGKITFDRKQGAEARLVVRFPVEKEHRFVYPEMGSGSNTTIRLSDGVASGGGNLLDLIFPGLSGNDVKISGSGSGLQIWADVTVKVPRGKSLEVKHGVGAIETSGTVGDLSLDSHSGPVTVNGCEGALSVDTGSGEVRVSDANGKLAVDTGSGNVDLFRCRGTDLKVDTGSGDVSGEGIDCDAMLVDTGSGDVSVLFKRMGKGDYLFDTGSGSVELGVPAGVSARFSADTGSGGIDVDLPGAQIHKGSADDLTFRTGDGAASVKIDTGSGSIRVSVAKP